MATDKKTSALTPRGTPDRANDTIYVVNGSNYYRSTINNELGISGNPVGDSDTQTLTNKTLTAPALSSPIFSGTITGTYTLGGTPTFPSSVVTLTGTQTLTNKTLTSPTLNTPTLTNASISADAITGFTTANSGTIYGVSVSGGVFTGNNIVPNNSLSNTGTFGSAWAFQSWVPTWTGTTMGNATVVANFSQTGKKIDFHIAVTIGSTTVIAGPGVDTLFSLPVTARTTGYLQYVSILGRGASLHGGVLQLGAITYFNSTTAIIAAEKVTAATVVTNAWNSSSVGVSTGDTWGLTGTYEAA